MKLFKLWVPLCAAALVVAGCAGQSGTEIDDDGFGSDGGSGADTFGDGGGADGGSGTALESDIVAFIMNNNTIYFAFDSSELDDASIETLRQHGRYLADNPGEQVRLEGHSDERGSREYNIGLGERRAVSVQSMLLANGANQSQLVTVSFGEERPADPGTNEDAWALNRRVELVYQR